MKHRENVKVAVRRIDPITVLLSYAQDVIKRSSTTTLFYNQFVRSLFTHLSLSALYTKHFIILQLVADKEYHLRK